MDDHFAPAPALIGVDDIVQEFVPGTEYAPNLYVAADPADDVVVVLEKTSLAHGEHGNATGVRLATDATADAVGALALRAARVVGLTGPVDVDVRLRADGTPAVLELNARFGANSAHAPAVLDAVLADGGWASESGDQLADDLSLVVSSAC